MRCWAFRSLICGLVLLLLAGTGYFVAVFCGFDFRSSESSEEHKAPGEERLSEREIQEILAPTGVMLPETKPPPGLDLITWGKRDCFPMIRRPKFLTAAQSDAALAKDEPVLGLVLGSDVRAYSTNQLNSHELVLDELGGIPVLVSY